MSRAGDIITVGLAIACAWKILSEPKQQPVPEKPIKAPAAKKPAQPRKKLGGVPKSKIDHGRIVALYTANPPRSISWIADDLRCSPQTVINHLKAEGIYRGRK